MYRFTVIGLNEERCATERLIERQFGLRFARSSAKHASDTGKDAHRVAKLDYASLDADDRRRVRSLNAADRLLYAEAQILFRRRLRAYGIPRDVRCR